jgi:5'-phosphate synthase pdxT subunit
VGPVVGVLALQGDFEEHIASLCRLGVDTREVRTEQQLSTIDRLIVPGGESTSMAKLMDADALRDPLRRFALSGRPVWGTCAGLILLAKRLLEDRPEPLGVMDTMVQRNGFGRQVDSFTTTIRIEGLDGSPYEAVFIRAPKIVEAGPSVEVLATLPDGTIVAARQDNMLVTAFHPELTRDDRVHRLFVDMPVGVASS